MAPVQILVTACFVWVLKIGGGHQIPGLSADPPNKLFPPHLHRESVQVITTEPSHTRSLSSLSRKLCLRDPTDPSRCSQSRFSPPALGSRGGNPSFRVVRVRRNQGKAPPVPAPSAWPVSFSSWLTAAAHGPFWFQQGCSLFRWGCGTRPAKNWGHTHTQFRGRIRNGPSPSWGRVNEDPASPPRRF